MRWLVTAREKTFNGVALILVSAAVAAGCSANPPEGGDRGQAVDANTSMGFAVTPEISAAAAAAVLRAHAPLGEQALSGDASTLWVSLGTFTFDYDNARIGAADLNKASEISEYVSHNSALRIVIDGSVSPRGIDAHNPGLRDRRVEVVREALIAAGVSPYIIETRAFGNERAMGDPTVDVLVKTSE
ncbi:MAG: hypothetical protein EHM59_08190 [Betaproteobacteria bacterium]|nr:MAG: hypothetical protein EHM59_08190 [Betaproteobacteria bacterium]